MGPCCQIPNHHPGYLLQSLTVEIEMCFPNQSWSWDGAIVRQDTVADAWGPDTAQNSSERCCWKMSPHIVYSDSHGFPYPMYNTACSRLLSSHVLLWTPEKIKFLSSPHLPQTEVIFVRLTNFSLWSRPSRITPWWWNSSTAVWLRSWLFPNAAGS